MAFAEKLIAIRRAHHLTQEQLAAKLFVTRRRQPLGSAAKSPRVST